MKTTARRIRRGFTLVEMSIAIMLGLAIGTMVISLFNQQVAFLKIYQKQTFLTEEAPMISQHVRQLVGKADRFRLHDSVSDALAGTNPRLTASPVLLLNFRQPDGSMRASILAFQNLGTGNALYYYVVPNNGVLGSPQWAVTKRPKNVQFSMDQGVLRMTITGPNDEKITYSGTMQK